MAAQEDYPEEPVQPERDKIIWCREVVWAPHIARQFGAIMSKKYNLKKHNAQLDGVNLETLDDGGLTLWATNGFVLGRSLCPPSQGCFIGEREQRLFVEWQAFDAFASAIDALSKALRQPAHAMPTVAVTTWEDKESPAIPHWILGRLEARIGPARVILTTLQTESVEIDYQKLYPQGEPVAQAVVKNKYLRELLKQAPDDYRDTWRAFCRGHSLPEWLYPRDELLQALQFVGDDTVWLAFYAEDKPLLVHSGLVKSDLARAGHGNSALVVPL
jgi:hypothetical protein